MQLSQPTLELHSLCYTCWVQVVYSHLLPLPSFILLWIYSTAAQFPATWRTTSMTSTASRRFVSQSTSLWRPASERVPYLVLRFRCIRLFCHYCNNNIRTRLLYLFTWPVLWYLDDLLYIYVTWSWRIYDCSVYVLYKPGVTRAASHGHYRSCSGSIGQWEVVRAGHYWWLFEVLVGVFHGD